MLDAAALQFGFDNSFARTLEGFYVPWKAVEVRAPELLKLNLELAEELGIDVAALQADLKTAAGIFSGNVAPEGSTPLAQVYAGHQFGHFSEQLGDGRALLLGEVVDVNGQRRDVQLKGAGRTPFSRGGDGKAPLGPVLREYLIGEAMHGLGIPTTRALAAVATGEPVMRETPLPGAVLTRVAASHIRVGTFQFFAARRESEKVQQLADYVIARHYPELSKNELPYLALFDAVANAQAALIARWMQVGFIHGVMNTDNMTISGETIDYGPCAFMDAYVPNTVFSSIDEGGRYAYANQPLIAQWNLTRFAECLLEIAHPEGEEAMRLLTESVKAFPEIYLGHWLSGMRAKIGLVTEEEGDLELANTLLSAMAEQGADYTLVFRKLSSAVETGSDDATVRALFEDPAAFDKWLSLWRTRLAREDIASEARANAMDAVNPIYIPRNHKVEEALSAAVNDDDLAPFEKLLDLFQSPFTEIAGLEAYAEPAPKTSVPYRTFCGT